MESLTQVLFYDIMKMMSILPDFKNENIVKRLSTVLILGIMKVLSALQTPRHSSRDGDVLFSMFFL